MNFRSFRIAPRAAIAFSIITVFVLLLGAFAFEQIRDLRSTQQTLENDWLPSIQKADDIQIALLHTRLEGIRLLASTDSEVFDTTAEAIKRNRDELNTLTDYYRRYLISGEQEKARFEEASTLMKQYLDGLDHLVGLARADRDAAIEYANGPQADNAKNYQIKLTALRDVNSEGVKESGEHSAVVYEHSLKVMFFIVIISLLVTVLLAWRLTKSMSSPIGDCLGVAEAIARGELNRSINVSGKDEAAGLMQALKQMQENLRQTIQGIVNSSAELTSSATQMQTVTDKAGLTQEQQNGQIDQAATAVTQMSAAVEEVARNATSTSESARESSHAAKLGNSKVTQTLDAMKQLTSQVEITSEQVQDLADQAQNIAEVVSVIQAIAGQTNLLALNAAIEAARAGEQGRGFAVVADEVRALAQRTQESTKKIESMIIAIQEGTKGAVSSMQTSTSQAHATYNIAQEAGKALQEIMDAVQLIEERNMQIATASEEQAYVAREVDRNLISIRDLSGETEKGTHHIMSASKKMSGLAVDLDGMVRKFTL
ncbi:HAMP domain-containing protein [Pseudomonas syringae]|nr:methyl-accepting chemotaxis protein [Pseudomonas syringae]MCF5226267.1 HAMP domain-containing protein [Pseudomonas syringae]MCF5244510.1 HAMP domain-containing protein [Pseudomonas syringae]